MNQRLEVPGISCDGWVDGGEIPIEYTAPRGANVQKEGDPQPQNIRPNFTFTNIPEGTKQIALVIHDILDGDPDQETGKRPGWTHWTAIADKGGKVIREGEMNAGQKEDQAGEIGYVGPYPEGSGEYHCTAYFLNKEFPSEMRLTRANILALFEQNGLGSANMVGRYTNPKSKSNN